VFGPSANVTSFGAATPKATEQVFREWRDKGAPHHPGLASGKDAERCSDGGGCRWPQSNGIHLDNYYAQMTAPVPEARAALGKYSSTLKRDSRGRA